MGVVAQMRRAAAGDHPGTGMFKGGAYRLVRYSEAADADYPVPLILRHAPGTQPAPANATKSPTACRLVQQAALSSYVAAPIVPTLWQSHQMEQTDRHRGISSSSHGSLTLPHQPRGQLAKAVGHVT